MKSSYGIQCESSLLLDRNSRKIYKMVKAFYRATDPFTIRESWAAVGISVLRDHKGLFCGIEADSVAVLANHVTLENDRTKKKRALLSTTNRAETDLVSQGLCPCCRRPVEDPTAANQGQKQQITRIRLVIRTDWTPNLSSHPRHLMPIQLKSSNFEKNVPNTLISSFYSILTLWRPWDWS